jgi:PAS domain S-box-containing protein
MAPAALLALLSLALEGGELMVLRIIGQIWSLYFCVTTLAFIVYAAAKKNRQAAFVLAGFGALICGAIVFILKNFGLLPATFMTMWSWQIGSAFMALLFSLGLFDKFNAMKKSLEKSDELLRKTNMELFTANEELQASNEELNASNEEFEAINEELVDSQRRIEENEKKLRAMLEHLPLPVLFVKERDIEFMNLAFTRTFGHSRTESPVMSAIMERLFLDEHARERVINEFVETASTLQSGEGRALGIHKMACRDGTMRDIDLKVSRMDNMSIVLFNDITEKRMMEKERDRLIALIEATSDMVSMSTPDTSVFYINNAGRKMLDIGHANPLSLKITDLHPLWAYEIIKTEGLPAAIEKGTWQGETAVLTGKGGEIPVSQVIISHNAKARLIIFQPSSATYRNDAKPMSSWCRPKK